MTTRIETECLLSLDIAGSAWRAEQTLARFSRRKPHGRAQTQTALIVHKGRTQLALDVENKGKRHLLTNEGDVITVEPTRKPKRTKKADDSQGRLF